MLPEQPDASFKEFLAQSAIEYYDVETDAVDGDRVVLRTRAEWIHPDPMDAIHPLSRVFDFNPADREVEQEETVRLTLRSRTHTPPEPEYINPRAQAAARKVIGVATFQWTRLFALDQMDVATWSFSLQQFD